MWVSAIAKQLWVVLEGGLTEVLKNEHLPPARVDGGGEVREWDNEHGPGPPAGVTHRRTSVSAPSGARIQSEVGGGVFVSLKQTPWQKSNALTVRRQQWSRPTGVRRADPARQNAARFQRGSSRRLTRYSIAPINQSTNGDTPPSRSDYSVAVRGAN